MDLYTDNNFTKTLMLDVHLKSNTMSLYSYICTHRVG